jgi:hypothetical protein
VEQRRLSIGGLPRRRICPWRFAACGLALWAASFPASTQAWSMRGLVHEVDCFLVSSAPAIRTEWSSGPQHRVRLAEMWETESSVRYGSGADIGESERLRRENKDNEERSWQMLENLSIEPHVTKKPSRAKPLSTPRNSPRQTTP